MADYFNNDLEYIDGDYFDMDDINFFVEELELDGQLGDDDHYELERALDLAKQRNDTSASDYRNGKDMQGIPWERLNHSRKKYREMRLKVYKNYENLSGPVDGLEKECKQVESTNTFYDFHYNTRLVKSTIVHFQAIKKEDGCAL